MKIGKVDDGIIFVFQWESFEEMIEEMKTAMDILNKYSQLVDKDDRKQRQVLVRAIKLVAKRLHLIN